MNKAPSLSLREYNTFGVEARAAAVTLLEEPADVERMSFDPDRDLVLGGGSNVLFAGDVPGTVYLNRLCGRRVVSRDDDSVLIEAAAGEDWHALVAWSLDEGLSGLENLSLIPGRVGAAPMQNIGAYGVELAEHLVSVTARDLHQGAWVTFDNRACRFAYRDSLFKSGCPGRYLITSVRLRLPRRFRPALGYAGLAQELAVMGVARPTPRLVSEAVIRIRRRKLPDPAATGNAGSFFKNPEIALEAARALGERHPGLPVRPAGPGQAKLSAAWMIDQCGWKGFREGDAGVSRRHALVLVNHGRAEGRQLLDLARRIQDSVREAFGVTLEPEPKIIGAP